MDVMNLHHVQQDVAVGRPEYRDSRRERAVKVYTVNQESRYLLVQNVHALGVTTELMEIFSIYGDIDEFRLLDEFPAEDYCDVYWIKFSMIGSARLAKKKIDNKSFYGKNLHVCYAPEYETRNDVRMKLLQRREVIHRKTCSQAMAEKAKLSSHFGNRTGGAVKAKLPHGNDVAPISNAQTGLISQTASFSKKRKRI